MISTKILSFDMRGAIRRRGNPDLDPERTIAYEVGIIRQFTDDLTIDITGFTKDIDKLVNSVHVDITNDYSYFLNGEFEGMLHGIYGRVQGFELTIRKWRHRRKSGLWTAQLHLFRREGKRFQSKSGVHHLLPATT